jgi:hypothetical protein
MNVYRAVLRVNYFLLLFSTLYRESKPRQKNPSNHFPFKRLGVNQAAKAIPCSEPSSAYSTATDCPLVAPFVFLLRSRHSTTRPSGSVKIGSPVAVTPRGGRP